MAEFITFNNEADAIALNNAITAMLQPLWGDGITNNYCTPKKHPEQDLWAVIIEPGYEECFSDAQLNEAVELTEDWFQYPTF